MRNIDIAQLDVIFYSSCFKNQGCRVSLFLGESGLGKSTLINSLFLTDLYKDRKVPNAQGKISSIVYIHVVRVNEVGE